MARYRLKLRDVQFLAGLLDDKPSKWTGGVERRDPASYQRPSEISIRICVNPSCRSWTPKRYRDCVICGAIQPAV